MAEESKPKGGDVDHSAPKRAKFDKVRWTCRLHEIGGRGVGYYYMLDLRSCTPRGQWLDYRLCNWKLPSRDTVIGWNKITEH